MFEVGFSEIILILGLALLVLGPEKLPGLAAKVGRWTGRARAMARQLRTQLEQEVTMEELARSRPMQPTPPATDNTIHPASTSPIESDAHPSDAHAVDPSPSPPMSAPASASVHDAGSTPSSNSQ
jgi:sec-independent protein translocase protein TatB